MQKSNKLSSSLFRLVKSLSKPEKGYFKKYISFHVQGERNNYAVLFDIIDGLDRYDNDLIRRKAAEAGIKKRADMTERYLFDTILRSLGDYYIESSEGAGIQRMLHHAEILYEKSLYHECGKILEKAKQAAGMRGRYLSLLEILSQEEELLRSRQNLSGMQRFTGEGFREEHMYINLYRNVREYKELMARVYAEMIRKGPARSPGDLQKLSILMKHPLLSSANKALSFEAKSLFYDIHSAFYFAKGDSPGTYRYSRELVRHLESSREQMSAESGKAKYIYALSNLLAGCLKLKRDTDFFEYLRKLRGIPAKSVTNQARIFTRSYSLELSLYNERGQFSEGLGIISDITRGLDRFKTEISSPQRLLFYYNIAYLCFGNKMYRDALRWLNNIRNDKTAEVNSILFCFAEIFSLIIHFELGNEDLLEHKVLSAYRALYKKNSLYKVENCLLSFIRKKLPKISSGAQLTGEFALLKKELEKIMRNPFEEKALEYFDFISWLESKIEGRPFAEIVREKAKK